MMPQWIVYITPDNVVEAVEDNHSGLQEAELKAELNVIVGTPSFKLKADAINYSKQRWL